MPLTPSFIRTIMLILVDPGILLRQILKVFPAQYILLHRIEIASLVATTQRVGQSSTLSSRGKHKGGVSIRPIS